MKILEAIKILSRTDRELVRYVFSKKDLRILFSGESVPALNKTIERLLDKNILEAVSKGVYLYKDAINKSGYIIEDIATVIRQGHVKYVSLESALSEYGCISQIPVSHITIMTTGRSGTFVTPYGVIEFTHTKKRKIDIFNQVIRIENRPLPIAKKETALADLKRVGRNLTMLEELNE